MEHSHRDQYSSRYADSHSQPVAGPTAMVSSTARCITPGQWDQHRATITQLYVGENRTLKEVMVTMESHYGFFATTRMYKRRLHQWDLHKYVKKRGQVAIPRGGRGTAVGKSKQLVSGPAASAIASPVPRKLPSPETFRIPEIVIELSTRLVAGQLEAGVWTVEVGRPSTADRRTELWSRNVEASARMIAWGEYKKGFRALSACFDESGNLFDQPDIGVFMCTVLAILRFPPPVGQQLLRYLAKLLAIKFPKNHPLNLLWSTLNHAGYQQVWQLSHFTVLERYFGHLHREILDLTTRLFDLLDWLHFDKKLEIDSDKVADRLTRLVERWRAIGDHEHAQDARLVLGYRYSRIKDHDKAEQISNEVLDWCRTRSSDRMGNMVSHCLEIRWWVALGRGDFDAAMRAGKDLVLHQLDQNGESHAKPQQSISHIEAHCRENGRLDLARDIGNTLITQWKTGRQIEEARVTDSAVPIPAA
ncbi:Clr5 domain-containing protein [Xylariales sp. AK1849]|nr:Clr5 domain-containing protein [Xylariales sp. AK1849]